MADAELTAAIKLAKTKKMFFAFFPKGAEGKLIVSKVKIPPKKIADTKKELGAAVVVSGKCQGEGGTLVFQTVKAAPTTMAAAVKRVVKKETGMPLDVEFRLAGDADAEEAEAPGTATPEAAAASPVAPPAAPPAPGKPAPTAAAGQANMMGYQKALQKLGFDPGKIDGIDGPRTQAAVKKFQQSKGLKPDGIVGALTQAALAKALQGGAAAAGGAPAGGPGASAAPIPKGPPPAPAQAGGFDLPTYQSARQTVISSLKALAGKVAGTKHGSAAGVLKEINLIITKLPSNPAPNELDKLRDFISNDEVIAAAEDVPGHFHELDIKEPLLKAWKS
jgi:peptidoglycan hydrolase-like protein with peptidoglycan-binding domain